ncbi:alpha/beta-hydrolase [Byssothecium circinans]|uniref:sn-1-specific diacylglycerol lipase n=1 Tax=Byssothecium circinans TaxID=147558 RepID=A0A6A5UE71_9PLEO|nr:alpha/beta-hydrolase [Byssothecium circinans]
MVEKEHRKKFRLFSRFSRNKTSVAAAATSTGAMGVSGAASHSQNSAAMSRNIEQASIRLQEYLETQEENGKITMPYCKAVLTSATDDMPPDVTSMSRWIAKTNKFSNSSYGDGSLLSEAAISAAHRKLIDLAAVSSKLVYGISTTSLMLKEPERFQAVGPGENLAANLFFGTVKAMHVRLFGADLDNNGSLTPVVVVAIRGTASVRDWSVNFNHSSNNHTQAGDFLGETPEKSTYKVHSGYLESAIQSVSALEEAILRLLLDQSLTRFLEPPQLLFTGHSAGGAVASILYAHLNNRNQHCLSSTQNLYSKPGQPTSSPLQKLHTKFSSIHLITFGAPPVTTPSIPLPLNGSSASSNAACYAIINEGDPIPRADDAYIDALLRLFVYVPPATPTLPASNPSASQLSSLGSQLSAVQLSDSNQPGPRYELPRPQLRNAGQILLLRGPGSMRSASYLPVFWNTPKEGSQGALEEMLFANPAMHHMLKYLERLGLVENKRSGSGSLN